MTEFNFVPAPDDCPIHMAWILLGTLRIPLYQRPEPQRIDEMVESWNILYCGALIVSWRDNAFWTVDGQTRAKAARRIGLDRLPAVVLTGLDETSEAHVFLHLNAKRLSVAALARHAAEVVARDPRAVAIDEVLFAHGLTAAASREERTNDLHFFKAIGAAEDVYNDGGAELIHRVFVIIEQAFPREVGRFRGGLVRGLGYFLARDPWEAGDEKVARSLSRISGQRLDEIATHWQQVTSNKGRGNHSRMHMARAVASVVYRSRGTEWKPRQGKRSESE